MFFTDSQINRKRNLSISHKGNYVFRKVCYNIRGKSCHSQAFRLCRPCTSCAAYIDGFEKMSVQAHIFSHGMICRGKSCHSQAFRLCRPCTSCAAYIDGFEKMSVQAHIFSHGMICRGKSCHEFFLRSAIASFGIR